ncbi:hypothetical protein [Rhizobacter sp. LjRoot28]|jgi:hypothetical protein|uniref:hypothetical protein n=1 Tax=Rhizobacter sp. LjRoot28 TaxID=3342309 RepID=UPI003ECF1D03
MTPRPDARPSARSPRDGLFAGVWSATAPLAVWALHFAFSYVAVAAMCTRAVAAAPPSLMPMLVGVTVIALLVLAVWTWRALRSTSDPTLIRTVRRTCALLALLGVAWTAVPLALLVPCAN